MIDKKAFAMVYFCKQKAGGIDVRLFVAVDLSGEVKAALEDIQGQLKGSGVHGRYTAKENLHITLAFIGEYGDAQAVLDALEGVRFEPFGLGLDGMGSFGGLWWAGIRAGGGLKGLAAQVRRQLAMANIPFDRKKFSPHITLIRDPDKQVIPQVKIPDVKMTVEGFSLMLSERGKRGMIYTELGTVSAGKEEETI